MTVDHRGAPANEWLFHHRLIVRSIGGSFVAMHQFQIGILIISSLEPIASSASSEVNLTVLF